MSRRPGLDTGHEAPLRLLEPDHNSTQLGLLGGTEERNWGISPFYGCPNHPGG